jgi:alpha-beta hydrolase superfamily lysophospholipase
MLRWNKKIQSYAPISQPIVIIQGTKDESVEWSYNLPFISQLFANCKIHLIQDAGHTLFCELPAFREKVIQLVLQALQTVEKTTITP